MRSSGPRRVRLVDVAEAAGTSAATASRILNGATTFPVSEELRRRVVETARGLGYRRIAHVAGPLDIDPAARRAEAFERRTWELGLEHTIAEEEFLESGGVRAFERLRAEHDRSTAIYTSTVSQGVGVIAAAARHRIEIPRQLSVIAHADMPLADFLVPPLSAIRVPLVRLAAVAVDALLEQIRTGATGDVVVEEDPELVVRASTAPPAR